MTSFEEAMSAPKIEVIDAAIECLQGRGPGFVAYSCPALYHAALHAHCGLRCSGQHLVALRYVEQYRQSCLTVRGKRPWWWWNSTTAGPEPRLRALRRFRQLCLDAAR